MTPDAGILLVGHGTRSDAGTAEFLALAQRIEQRLAPTPVVPCFLELREPSISAGIAQLAALGARQIVVAPLLLFSAGHAQHDIPAAVAQAIARHPEMVVFQSPTLDCHPRLVELSQTRFSEVARGSAPAEETLLILVGRGSHDAEAIAAMHRFAALRHELADVGETRVAFVAMAEPRVRAVLQQASAEPWKRIVVQPHLLFQGELLTDLRHLVAEFAAGQLEKTYLVADHLAAKIGVDEAADRLLVEAVVDQIRCLLPEAVTP